MNVKELIQKSLIEIIEEIQTTKQMIIENKYEKIQNEYAQAQFEKKVKGDIANVVDDKQKAVFSNQEKREIEFVNRTELDNDYKMLKDFNQNLNRQKDDLYLNLEVLEKVFETKKLEMELSK